MPRYLLEGRYWDRIREHEYAARVRGIMEFFEATGRDPGFVDYYPDLLATKPEKHLFRALVERRINFYQAPYWGDFPFTVDKKEKARPDFLLPDYKIIIEVLSTYWHSRWGVPNRDAVRHAMYTASGFQVYYFSDDEIMRDINACLDSIPELVNPAIRGDRHIISDRPQDPVAAIVARLKKFPKVVRTKHRTKARRRSPLQLYRPTGRRVKKHLEIRQELHKYLSEEMLTKATELYKSWSEYMVTLGEAVADGYRGEYYYYWLKWKDYLNRWT
jgi:hypothetical protein